jgi:hypothetical protein
MKGDNKKIAKIREEVTNLAYGREQSGWTEGTGCGILGKSTK